MREIKFRGKRLDNEEWVYGDLLRRSGETYIVYEDKSKDHNLRNIVIDSDNNPSYPPVTDWTIYALVDPEKVGQYICRTDKHNKEIYEGDICKYAVLSECNNEDCINYSEVEYEQGVCEIIHGQCGVGEVALPWTYNIDIIGNKYDNPELLEERSK